MKLKFKMVAPPPAIQEEEEKVIPVRLHISEGTVLLQAYLNDYRYTLVELSANGFLIRSGVSGLLGFPLEEHNRIKVTKEN